MTDTRHFLLIYAIAALGCGNGEKKTPAMAKAAVKEENRGAPKTVPNNPEVKEAINRFIRHAAGVPSGPLTVTDYEKVTELNATGWGPITDLAQMKRLTKLKKLNLLGNRISDLSPLINLKELEYLHLYNNQITNLKPLTGLANLKTLMLNNNKITDITPLADLKKLEHLSIGANNISNVTPLTGLINMDSLDLGSNQINDLKPLTRMTQLTFLQLGDNQIADLTPLRGMTNLLHISGLGSNPELPPAEQQKLQKALPNCIITR